MYLVKNAADFDDQLKKAGEKIVVAKFFSNWCVHCKTIRPAFEKLAKEYSAHIVAIEVEVEECADLAVKFKIESLPTFVFLKNGEKIEQWFGSKANKLEEMIQQQIDQGEETT